MFYTLLTFLGLVNVTRLRGNVDQCTSVSVSSPEWHSFKDAVTVLNNLGIRYSLFGDSAKYWYNNCSLGDTMHFAIDPSADVALLKFNLVTSMWYPVDNAWKKYGRTAEFVTMPLGYTERHRWNGLYIQVRMPSDMSMV